MPPSDGFFEAAAGMVKQLGSFWKSKRKAAASQLRILASSSPHNASAIAAAGAIPPLIKLLHGSSKGCQEQAAGALASLAYSSHANAGAITAAGGVPPLVKLLSSSRGGVQEQAVAALHTLAAASGSSCSALKAAGALPALAKLLGGSSNAVVRAEAAAVMRHLQGVRNPTGHAQHTQQGQAQQAQQQGQGQQARQQGHQQAQQAQQPAQQQQQQQQQEQPAISARPAPRRSPPPVPAANPAAAPSPSGKPAEHAEQRLPALPPRRPTTPAGAELRPVLEEEDKPSQLPAEAASRHMSDLSLLTVLPGADANVSLEPPPRPSASVLASSVRRVEMSDLQLGRLLGDESISSVHKAAYQGKVVAVKQFMRGAWGGGPSHVLHLSDLELEQMVKEAAVMASVSHRNCCRFVGVCTEPPSVVTEYFDRGSLADVLKQARSDPAAAAELSWPRRLAIALDAACGMAFLHSRQPAILHLNLKSNNLLVTRDWRVKVADFNLSRALGPALGTITAAQDPCWLAPEVINGDAFTKASDVYSFACVMWEILTWDVPWGKKHWQVVMLVSNGGRLEVPDRKRLPGGDTPGFQGLDKYVALMKRCWAENVYDRPGFAEVISELGLLLDTTAASSGTQGGRRVAHDGYASAAFGAGVLQSVSRPACATGH